MSLDRYLAGEDDCLQAAILEMQPLADQMVISFLEKAPGFLYLEDDLKSECYLQLVEVLPTMRHSRCDETDANPKGYLSKVLHRHINEFVDKDKRLGMPDTSQRRAYYETKANPNRRDKRPVVGDFDSVHHTYSDRHALDEQAAVEAFLTIKDCCRSREDEMIVDMRSRGFTQEEISTELEISQPAISRMLNELQEQVEKELA